MSASAHQTVQLGRLGLLDGGGGWAYVTYSILPTDKFGIFRSTSGGLVVVLLDAELVDDPPAVAVAPVPLELLAPGEEDTVVEASVDEVEAADCAVENETKLQRANNKKP